MANTLTAPPHNIFTEFLDNPYSAEALALLRKEIVVADTVSFDVLPKSDNKRDQRLLKHSGQEADTEVAGEVFAPLHNHFINTLNELLGNDLYDESRIFFDYFYAELNIGDTTTFWLPHLDGTAPGGYNWAAEQVNGENGSALKLIGFACDILPTITLQGPTSPKDYYGEPKTQLKSNVAHSLAKEEIPVDRLVIMPPSLPHYAQPAVTPTTRHAVRWQVMIG
ncbi:hypothetical protein KBB49_03000 [Candidatus Saccharibacteria bacterium]|jgi:hypothetical protein|nr:hypothetical protein [Candidatus Saccharibacteria bacterium]